MDDLDVNDKAPLAQPLAQAPQPAPEDARAAMLKSAMEAASVMPAGGFVPLTRATKPVLMAPPQAAQAQAQAEAQKIYDVGMHNGYVTGVAAGVAFAVVAGIGAFGVYKVVSYVKSAVGETKSIVH